MTLVPGLFSNNDGQKANWKGFIFFLLICLILGVGLIYIIFPGFFSGPAIQRIPIIIENQNEEVMGFLRLYI